MPYPTLSRDEQITEIAGHKVADPYRVLEDPDHPITRQWSEVQDALWATARGRLAARDWFDETLHELMPGEAGLPFVHGERTFFMWRDPDQRQPVLKVRHADGTERILVDPVDIDPEGTTTIDSFAPSDDGALVAVQWSEGGDEESVLRVLDVDTGAVVDGPIDRCRYSPVAWLADGSGFFYMRTLAPAEVPDGDAHLERRVWFHRLGTDAGADRLVAGSGATPGTYFGLQIEGGRWLVVTASVGTEPRNDLWLGDLGAIADPGDVALTPVRIGVDAQDLELAWAGDRFVVLTDLGAPRRRIMSFDPADPDPARWHELVAESESVITEMAVTSEHLVVARTLDVIAHVAVHDRRTGERAAEVELPGLGVVTMSAARHGAGTRAWISYSDHVTAGAVLELDPATATTSVWALAPGAPEVTDVDVRQLFATSADGTQVPMFVIGPSSAGDGPRPTILYGYGGFGVALTPDFSATIVAWVRAGGIWAVANLRGGDEYGEDWHRAGMREHKHHVFEDLEACADLLVADGLTTPDQLGIQGGSNGGLLVGVALTRSPERYRSAVCSAPLLDMVRYERFGLGRTWNDEYGTADDHTELGWLLSYSPYHCVRDGEGYPATLFTVFANDTRVDPLHARKLCAALQHATSGDPETHPIVLRAERDVGHGARSVDRRVALAADQLGFQAEALGLRV